METKNEMIQDRKTGQWYDPIVEFQKLQQDQKYIDQMVRMKNEEGIGWPTRTGSDEVIS